MNVFALQGLFGGARPERNSETRVELVDRTGSGTKVELVGGAESEAEGFAALLQLAVEQQPTEPRPIGLDFARSRPADLESRESDTLAPAPPARTQAPSQGVATGSEKNATPVLEPDTPFERVPSDAGREESRSAVAPKARSGRAHSVQLAELVERPVEPTGRSEDGPDIPSAASQGTKWLPIPVPSPVSAQEGPRPVVVSRTHVAHDEPTFAPRATPVQQTEGREPVPAVNRSSPEPLLAADAPEGPDPDRDLRRLDPRLRVAVQRVLRRLDKEFGIDAKVAEGYRTADRQKTLFAQGRTLPGKVVTWTLDSAHTKGRAVDLILNGQWTDLEPYRVLQMVAQEEGLHTLGMKDPGHLQLPASAKPMRTARVELDAVAPAREAPATVRRRRSVRQNSGLAFTARVAGVAGRASVAQAAVPAVPGLGGLSQGRSLNIERSLLASARLRASRVETTSSPSATSTGMPKATPTITAADVATPRLETALPQAPGALPEPKLEVPVDRVAASDGPSAPDTRDTAEKGASDSRVATPVASLDSRPAEVARGDAEPRGRTASGTPSTPTSRETVEAPQERSPVASFDSGSPGPVSRTAPVRPMGDAGIAGRVEQVQSLQEAAQARAPGMRVDLGDVDGAGTRVRLDLRGGRVDARIEVNDPALGNNLERKVDSLRAALEARGLEPETLQVRTVAEEPGLPGRLNALDPGALLDGDSRESRSRGREHSETSKDLPQQRRQDESRQRRENESDEGRNETRGQQ